MLQDHLPEVEQEKRPPPTRPHPKSTRRQSLRNHSQLPGGSPSQPPLPSRCPRQGDLCRTPRRLDYQEQFLSHSRLHGTQHLPLLRPTPPNHQPPPQLRVAQQPLHREPRRNPSLVEYALAEDRRHRRPKTRPPQQQPQTQVFPPAPSPTTPSPSPLPPSPQPLRLRPRSRQHEVGSERRLLPPLPTRRPTAKHRQRRGARPTAPQPSPKSVPELNESSSSLATKDTRQPLKSVPPLPPGAEPETRPQHQKMAKGGLPRGKGMPTPRNQGDEPPSVSASSPPRMPKLSKSTRPRSRWPS